MYQTANVAKLHVLIDKGQTFKYHEKNLDQTDVRPNKDDTESDLCDPLLIINPLPIPKEDHQLDR